ncbi:Alpha/beta-hydrolase family protein [Jannaschia seohaensis]|uniref:Alpha/beta-hydrolase family protein n=2 Tax=Jannaschia seohaensis TaxID=475081 RepID=A0A2Y9AK08_9RHOB|nr:alpha/beta hydrolase family protein [Jannaschia seohaensis]SSA44660.1 Alpha/beta-hydrolase family protein [Jannaschia seohaensis]
MHGGDVATVYAHSSYLQSPLAQILKTSADLEQATALQDVVHTHWRNLPSDARPCLYLHGLSLAACSSMNAANMCRLLDDANDGAFPPPRPERWRR